MKPFYPNLEKRIATFLLWLIVLFMLVNPIVRHLWPDAAFSPLRLAAMCLAWMISFGMAWAASLGLHIRGGLLGECFSDRNRRRLGMVSDAVFFAFSLAMMVIGLIVLANSLGEGWDGFSRSAVLAAIPVGSLLTCARLLERLIRARGVDS